MDFSTIIEAQEWTQAILVPSFLASAALIGGVITVSLLSVRVNARAVLLAALTTLALGSGSFYVAQGVPEKNPSDQVLVEQAAHRYGIDLSEPDAENLLGGQAHQLTAPERDFLTLGDTVVEIDDEPTRITLTYLNDEWVLLAGDPAEQVEVPTVEN